jgi:hypothetical protein
MALYCAEKLKLPSKGWRFPEGILSAAASIVKRVPISIRFALF